MKLEIKEVLPQGKKYTYESQLLNDGIVVIDNIATYDMQQMEEIVHRVNLHDELIEALKEAKSTIEYQLDNPAKFVSSASCKMSLRKIEKAIEKASNKTQGEVQK